MSNSGIARFEDEIKVHFAPLIEIKSFSLKSNNIKSFNVQSKYCVTETINSNFSFLLFFNKEKRESWNYPIVLQWQYISLCTGSESIRWEKGKGGDLRMGGQRRMEAVGGGRGGGGQKPYHAHQTVAANGIILNIISSFISHPCKHFPHHKVSIKAARNFCRFASFFNGIIVKI